MEPSQITAFLEKFDKGVYTEEEHSVFVAWLKTAPPADIALVVEAFGNITEAKTDLLPADPALAARVAAGVEASTAKLVSIHRLPFRRIAAAVVIAALGLSAFFFFKRRPAKQLAATGTESLYKNDLLPGGNKATLTLANGATIVLDSSSNGRLAQQGNADVIKTGSGQLSYTTLQGKPAELVYNSLSTPRGGQYQLVLPDGSKVWLNAASSLRFPTSFTGTERRVELTGEAYFEIAPLTPKGGSKKVPFIVRILPVSRGASFPPSGAGGAEVKVLGTHFNINAYPDEEAIKTTLLQGSVQLTAFSPGNNAPAGTRLLLPGQQASLNTANELNITDDINTDEVIAWTNNRFYFRSADIKTIMRQMARWYDVDVVYNKDVQGRFNAELPRNTYASDILKALELTRKVKFGIDGKKIIVMP